MANRESFPSTHPDGSSAPGLLPMLSKFSISGVDEESIEMRGCAALARWRSVATSIVASRRAHRPLMFNIPPSAKWFSDLHLSPHAGAEEPSHYHTRARRVDETIAKSRLDRAWKGGGGPRVVPALLWLGGGGWRGCGQTWRLLKVCLLRCQVLRGNI